MSRYARFCTQCGTSLSGELRFCTTCGAQVAEIPAPAPAPVPMPVVPVAVPTAAPPVSPPGASGGRWSPRTVGIGVGVILLVVAAGFGIKALVGGDDDEPVAASPGGTSVKASGVDRSDDPASVDEEFECWNGDTRSTQALCPGLRGSTAMKWLFPSFERDDGYGICSPANTFDQLTGVNKEVARGCDLTLNDGSNARIVYSQWPTIEDGLTHYQLKYGAVAYQRFNGQVNGWNARQRPNGRFQGSQMFAATFPYSVTVDASSPANVREGFGYVEFRSASETVGYDSGR